jgi:hypothetical protein
MIQFTHLPCGCVHQRDSYSLEGLAGSVLRPADMPRCPQHPAAEPIASAQADALLHGTDDSKAAPRGGSNASALGAAAAQQRATTAALRDGLRTVQETRAMATETAAQLESQTARVASIDAGLDDVQGELRLGGALLTRLAKRIYTDRVMCVLLLLLTLAAVGIVIAHARGAL